MRLLFIFLCGLLAVCGCWTPEASEKVQQLLDQDLTNTTDSVRLALAVEAYRVGAGRWPTPDVLRQGNIFNDIARQYSELRFDPLPNGGLAIHYRRSTMIAGAPARCEETIRIPRPATTCPTSRMSNKR